MLYNYIYLISACQLCAQDSNILLAKSGRMNQVSQSWFHVTNHLPTPYGTLKCTCFFIVGLLSITCYTIHEEPCIFSIWRFLFRIKYQFWNHALFLRLSVHTWCIWYAPWWCHWSTTRWCVSYSFVWGENSVAPRASFYVLQASKTIISLFRGVPWLWQDKFDLQLWPQLRIRKTSPSISLWRFALSVATMTCTYFASYQ